MTKRSIRTFNEVVTDIDKVIDKVHSARVDFSKGSTYQRLINDLDGARVTARAIIHLEDPPDDDIKAQTKPAKHSGG